MGGASHSDTESWTLGIFSALEGGVMKRHHPLMLVVSSVLALSACTLTTTQREAAGRFGNATSQIGSFVATELPQLRSTTIQMNQNSVAIRGMAKPKDLDGAFDPDTVETRVAAAEALTSYGQLLSALVEDTQEDELRRASHNFTTSFQQASGNKLSDKQLDGLGEIVQAIGRWFVEHKKAQAVKAIVPTAKDSVDAICDNLIKDFSPDGLALGQGMKAAITRLKSDTDIALADPNASFGDRQIAIEGRHLADQADARLNLVGARAVSTLRALKQANAELAAAVKDGNRSINDIKALGGEIKGLANAVKALSEA